ncbi:translation initiation factor IF-2 [candidate division GN15 bacterium]|nr:translation initiation factor IF-2 [candidate division GN15 bacterium]
MKKKRIYELAKEYKVSSNAMLKILNELHFEPKSHMSVATEVMQEAVRKKFAQEKKVAKKEMQQRTEQQKKSQTQAQPKQPPKDSAQKPGSGARIGGIKVNNSDSPVAGVMRRIEKKQKKKERRRKRDRRKVDSGEVAKSFKATMANLAGPKSRKKHRRDIGSRDADTVRDEKTVAVNEFMTVAELAQRMDHSPAEVISKLFEMGMMATINQRLDMDTIEMVASEFGYDVEPIAEVGEYAREEEIEENLKQRAPVVTVMGHVDHGKTSLLDYIRHSNVVAGEAGAITQHIGAYEVRTDSGRIAFLDTPGHEAFTAMRARGTQVTDIVVLIVAADDGVQPQTIEAIDHAKAGGVPIIVAINKIDKPGANIDNVKTQLANHNLMSEDWGGKTIMVEISAKKGTNVDKLLEMILLQAEMMDLQADPSIRAQGVVIEARLEKGRGPVSTVLIQRGTAEIGDSVVAGVHSGHIRTIVDDQDRSREKIGPSTPAQITGLSGVPQAGDSLLVVGSDQEAKEIAAKRSQIKREQDARRTLGRVSLDQVFDRIKEGQMKELRLIIKGDVDGSVEVLADTLGKIESEEVRATIIHQSVGTITESDVLLAAASNAVIIGFHVRPDARAREVAKQEKVDIRLYDIIYEAESDVKKALEGLLDPTVSEQFVGLAEVRNVFRVPKVGNIAGCYVREGRINRADTLHLVRDGRVMYKGTVGSLKRFKDDTREVKEGFECGIGIEGYNDIKEGDLIEAYQLVEEARHLS